MSIIVSEQADECRYRIQPAAGYTVEDIVRLLNGGYACIKSEGGIFDQVDPGKPRRSWVWLKPGRELAAGKEIAAITGSAGGPDDELCKLSNVQVAALRAAAYE